MRQRSIGYIGAMALAMSPLILEAQQPTPPERETPPVQSSVERNLTIEGKVVEVNAQRLVVRTNDGKQMTFTVNRDLTTGADPITVGERVRVVYSGAERLSIVTVNSLADEIEGAADRVEDAVDRTADKIEDAIDDPDDRRTMAQTEARDRDDRQRMAQTDPDDELPGTASPLPALILAGLALLGSGFGLSSRRRQ
jgi:LPXTG-motif cell wall-anchored protein